MKYVLFNPGLLENPEAEILLIIRKEVGKEVLRDCSVGKKVDPDMFTIKARVGGYDYFFMIEHDGKLHSPSHPAGEVIFCVPDHYLELFNDLSETFIYV